MIVLPDTPFQPIAIRSDDAFVSRILSRRLLSNNNTSSSISQLEDYLQSIVELVGELGVSYDDCLTYSQSVIISSTIPWQLHTKKGEWSLQDEIIIVCCNLSFAYIKRHYELMCKYTIDKDEKLWLNSFKLLKKGMEYVKSLDNIKASDSEIWQVSISFIKFVESCVDVSIQYTFLSKSLWKLKNTDYNIINNEINYSTLSKVAIHIKFELLNMLKETKYHKLMDWSIQLEMFLKLINGIIGSFVSIQNYKEDNIGVSIGFLNLAIDNITTKYNEDEDNKLKKKLISFKKKLTIKKLKINTGVYNKLSKPLQDDYTNLFELIERLQMRYHLDNNNLKFDKVVEEQELINYMPMARAVPVDYMKWTPNIALKSNINGYY